MNSENDRNLARHRLEQAYECLQSVNSIIGRKI